MANPRSRKAKAEAKADAKGRRVGPAKPSGAKKAARATAGKAKAAAPSNLGRPRTSAMGRPGSTAVARTGGGRAVSPKVYTGDVRNPKTGGPLTRRAMGPVIEGSKVGGRSLIGRAAGAAGRVAGAAMRTAGGAVAGILTPTRLGDGTDKMPYKGPVPTARPGRSAPTPTARPSRPATPTTAKAGRSPTKAPKPTARSAAPKARTAATSPKRETDSRFDTKAALASIKAKRNKEKND